MDIRWQEAQRAFQARVLTEDDERLGLRPYRTFIGTSVPGPDRGSSRGERLLLVVVTGAVVVTLLLALGVAREWAAFSASFAGGVAVMVGLSPTPPGRRPSGWTPLLAIYPPSVLRGAEPDCVTEISLEEFDRLGVEGFATVVGSPRPGATFGLFVDDHLVWPRTPPRGAETGDPGFGAS